MTITKKEKRLIWHLLFLLRDCFDGEGSEGTVIWTETIILPDLTKEQKEMFDNLINEKLLH
jgi:hypothetical protein